MAATADKPIRHAWIALLCYTAFRLLAAIVGTIQQPALARWHAGDFLFALTLLLLLGFGIARRSRIAAALAIAYVVAMQLYVWVLTGWPTGIFVSAIVVGFLVRGAKRIFEHHREQQASATSGAAG